MKKKLLLSTAAITIAVVLPQLSMADANKKQSRWDGTYVLAGGGGTVTARKIQVLNSNNEYDRQKLKSRTILRAEVGKSFLGDFRIGFEVNQSPDSKVKFTDGVQNSGREINGKIASMVGFVNFYYDMNEVDRTATPYIGFGLGMSRNKTIDLQRNWSSFGSTLGAGTDVFKKKFINTVAWKATLGMKLKITEMLFVDLSYNYANFGRLRTVLEYDSFDAAGAKQNTVAQSAAVFRRAHLREHVGIASMGLQF
jgi:opacity protein-like surface antigen